MDYKILFEKENCEVNERFDLVVSGIKSNILNGDFGDSNKVLVDYFKYVAGLVDKIDKVYANVVSGKLFDKSLEELQVLNNDLFGDIVGEKYNCNYANPSFMLSVLSDVFDEDVAEEYAKILSFLVVEVRACIPYAYEARSYEMTIILELFSELFNIFMEKDIDAVKAAKQAIYYYVSDYSDVIGELRVREQFDTDLTFAKDIIMNSDLEDLRYLYMYGEYVSNCEIEMAKHLNSLPEEDIVEMARTYTEGYRKGFIAQGIDLSKKSIVNIRFRVGFERVVRAAIEQFKEMGLDPVIYRTGVMARFRGTNKVGYYSTSPNNQYDYDHRFDKALFVDKAILDKFLVNSRNTYEKYKDTLKKYAGPACIEVFGEVPFEPQSKKSACSLSDKQEKFMLEYQTNAAILSNEFLKRDEISFTIIAYPVPDIGDDFKEIFNETVKVNTLDYKLYQGIQQTIIDALDKGDYVCVKGMAGNKTDIKVNLYKLNDPSKETIFENCVADVNIPVGEVFTSPVLKGTEGVLNVSEVYLNDLKYIDLELTFKDGKVTDYRCGNFDNDADGKKFIKENLLYNHETLPIGEFAIGTNTTAYVMGQNFGIADKLPILIAEKTGPHFAIGDTCYSMSEDLKVYNPDGKEIIARDNEISILRKTQMDKAYFNCHTDITIPYNELGEITVYTKDGEAISIIKEGRFVLEGTEELNKAFEALA
ncbi:MAG: leucyl aminopeptidase [Lachnospiraceae bacterium]|nr:leucyl aminopeptidase [Lachnospiraceae bacterium]